MQEITLQTSPSHLTPSFLSNLNICTAIPAKLEHDSTGIFRFYLALNGSKLAQKSIV